MFHQRTNHYRSYAGLAGLLIGLLILMGLGAPVAATPTPAPAPIPAAPATALPQTIVSRDELGYTTWSVDWSPLSWCVPVSTLRYPFDLGNQDPTELSDATLKLTFNQGKFGPQVEDPTWTVAFNGDPPDQWQDVGTIAGPLSSTEKIWSTETISVEAELLIDGENNIWLRQHDTCPSEPGCTTCACTCVEIARVELRAAVAMRVKSVSPAPDAHNVRINQRSRPGIRVRFNIEPDPASVNSATFQLYYLDQALQPVLVTGEVVKLSASEFAFVPGEDLRDGIRYTARIWGQEEALDESHDAWVSDSAGMPMESGRIWSFWTMPELQVALVPVQVLEGQPLIANKATLLRTFIRWERKPDVFELDQLAEVDIHDITLAWSVVGGQQSASVHWKEESYGWRPAYGAAEARRKREYRGAEIAPDIYDKFERLAARDSVNYFGFLPLETGTYMMAAKVTLMDNNGRPQDFSALATPEVVGSRPYRVLMRAIGVGADYGKSGTVDLSDSVRESLDTLRALFPVTGVTRPPAPSAMAYYTPTTSLWVSSWSSEPAGTLPKLYMLRELSALCARTSGCDAMVGFVPQGWLTDAGLSHSWAPQGVLVQSDTTSFYSFLVAHEIGHLFGFDHDTLSGGEGYNVAARADRRASVAALAPQSQRTLRLINSFMNVDPIESPPVERLWIAGETYARILAILTGGQSVTAAAPASTEPLLLVSGAIIEQTARLEPLPWYLLDPGPWTPPAAGPYRLVFLDAAGQVIADYTRAFGASTPERPSDPAFFTFTTPYPAATAAVQVRKVSAAGETLLGELRPSPVAPALTLDQPARTTWQGAQGISWQSDAGGPRFFALDISTDGGATWQALAVDLTSPRYTIETTALPNTTQAYLRIAASDGLRTTSITGGPYTIANPPQLAYSAPSAGAQGVGVDGVIVAGFRDAMAPTTIDTAGFVVAGGPAGSVPGAVSYNAMEQTAIFQPLAPLAYGTTYTATITTAVRDTAGNTLPAVHSWSFTTEAQSGPPRPLARSPEAGQAAVLLNSPIAVVWDRDLDPATLTTGFTLERIGGAAVAGVVSYDPTTRTATFSPTVPLDPRTGYIAGLRLGITSASGSPTLSNERWSFTTGNSSAGAFALTGAYSDAGIDDNGDGRFDRLVVRVGVQVSTAGRYSLAGELADATGAPITRAQAGTALPAGTSFIELAFSGAEIGGHGTDGPYLLRNLTLFRATAEKRAGPAITAAEVYQTFAYPAARFPASLRLSGLPDLLVTPGESMVPAFNINDFASHATQPDTALRYTIAANPAPGAGVRLDAQGNLNVNPTPGWTGTADVTIEASYGTELARDTFRVTVGWPASAGLPLVLNRASGVTARDNWYVVINESFEKEFAWRTWSSISVPPGGWYTWAKRDCLAHTGSYSAWPFGGSEDGARLACGASYPATLQSTMFFGMPINLKYTSRAELRMKVWSDLAPGDRICAMVTTEDLGSDNMWQAQYHGVCRSGKSAGWEDLVLDMSAVPTLGNLLGREKVWVAVRFIADEAESRPVGAYVDDVVVRLCPQGLTCPGS